MRHWTQTALTVNIMVSNCKPITRKSTGKCNTISVQQNSVKTLRSCLVTMYFGYFYTQVKGKGIISVPLVAPNRTEKKKKKSNYLNKDFFKC